jgi:hypothetical protein
MTFVKKLYFGILLLEPIAALSAHISDLLDDADFRNICTFDDYVSYKTSRLQFAAEAGCDCETADFKDPFLRVIKAFLTNGFLTDATEKLGFNLVGMFHSTVLPIVLLPGIDSLREVHKQAKTFLFFEGNNAPF